jgi:hypothetical protein
LHPRCCCPANIPQLNSYQLSTQLFRRLFSAFLADLDSTATLNWTPHSPTNYFTSLHSTKLHSADLGSLLYSLRWTQQKMLWGCSFPRERVYQAVA